MPVYLTQCNFNSMYVTQLLELLKGQKSIKKDHCLENTKNTNIKSNSTRVVKYCMPPPVQWWLQHMLFQHTFISVTCYIISVSLLKIRPTLFKTLCKQAQSACCFQHTVFQRDFDLWPFDPKLWRVHLCPIVDRRCKFGENVSNTLQDVVLTFQNAHRDACTDEQDKISMSPATLR